MKTTKRFIESGIPGLVARWYDYNTKKNRISEIQRYAKEIAGYIKENDTVLEIAPGPGQLSIELAKLGNYYIIGVELNHDFVDIAQQNAEEEGVEIDFQQGNAANITFPDNSFDFIICTAAFKSFSEPVSALNEAYRVLKPSGTLLMIDLNEKISKQEVNNYIDNLCHDKSNVIEKWSLKSFLLKSAYTKERLEKIIEQTSFKSNYTIEEKAISLYTHLHK
ncbi:MAG: class I SAM-dependent methyltransferase [Tannerellaceae bacterium]|jgi:ubiquinone/menaquinone biosynthesis C-methylase UbiE|nr:class I SAM-dependent methyltransferase [Tannerellaceae bacterium]